MILVILEIPAGGGAQLAAHMGAASRHPACGATVSTEAGCLRAAPLGLRAPRKPP